MIDIKAFVDGKITEVYPGEGVELETKCTFVQGSNLYRYGFIIEATSNIKEEWLYQKKLKNGGIPKKE